MKSSQTGRGQGRRRSLILVDSQEGQDRWWTDRRGQVASQVVSRQDCRTFLHRYRGTLLLKQGVIEDGTLSSLGWLDLGWGRKTQPASTRDPSRRRVVADRTLCKKAGRRSTLSAAVGKVTRSSLALESHPKLMVHQGLKTPKGRGAKQTEIGMSTWSFTPLFSFCGASSTWRTKLASIVEWSFRWL